MKPRFFARHSHVLFILACCVLIQAPQHAAVTNEWNRLFDGQSLQGWRITDFAGAGEVTVEESEIQMAAGAILTGVAFTNAVPKIDYEIQLEAKKIDGSDFFCGLTFPVNDSACTFIVGGWGGSLIGLSSLDGADASENETTQFMTFETDRWYKIRLRVTRFNIQTWIDGEQMANVAIAGRRISLRAGEIEAPQPLGVAAYQTASALRNIQLRSLPDVRKVVFLPGKKSHGPGEHDYEKGLQLLKYSIEHADNVSGIVVDVHRNGWPLEVEALDDADCIVLYSDGSDHDEKAHPLLRADRLELLEKQMRRGAGLVAIHYTLFVPSKTAGPKFLAWLGGYFDYETGSGANHWFSRIEHKEFTLRPAQAQHPILHGIEPFKLKEEFYFKMRFTETATAFAPLLVFDQPDLPERERIVAWAVERPDGGRGFAYTGGHYHEHWKNETVRRLVLNAILWSAKMTPPRGGVRSTLPPAAP